MSADFIIYKKGSINRESSDNGMFVYSLKNWIIVLSDKSFRYFTRGYFNYLIIGDLINESMIEDRIDIKKLKGNYYIMQWDKSDLNIYNNLFSILPIYHTEDKTIFSNSIQLIKKSLIRQPDTDKQFILENLLFNFGFSSRTLYKQIKLLACNSSVFISENSVSIKKHTNIIDYFSSSSERTDLTQQKLAEKFIETSNQYFPGLPFSITFTGGLDGRTLVACAKYYGKEFRSCSFGIRGNSDIEIPKDNSRQLQIPYQDYLLNTDKYLQTEFLRYAHLNNILNPGFNGYLYPQLSLLAEEESKHSKYLLTGYFGSELFRALHISGSVTSDVLVKIFQLKDYAEIRDCILASDKLKLFRLNMFYEELDCLIDEVNHYKEKIPQELTNNQAFYIFIFEEIFRKLFGNHINLQNQFIQVRTPYLDFDFITELFKTQYAGVNNEFFTHNPLKRYKGQVIYSEILKRTSPTIYRQRTSKGYKPSSLISPLGKVEIVNSYIFKKLSNKFVKPDLDNLGLISGIERNKLYLNSLLKGESLYFDNNYISGMLNSISATSPEYTRNVLLHTLSIIESLDPYFFNL